MEQNASLGVRVGVIHLSSMIMREKCWFEDEAEFCLLILVKEAKPFENYDEQPSTRMRAISFIYCFIFSSSSSSLHLVVLASLQVDLLLLLLPLLVSRHRLILSVSERDAKFRLSTRRGRPAELSERGATRIMIMDTQEDRPGAAILLPHQREQANQFTTNATVNQIQFFV